MVAEALLSRYISYFGIPNKIHSDLGKEFKNQIFDKLCNSLEINHTFTPVDVHNSNLSERSIRDLVKFFRILSDNEKATWSRFIPLFQIAQNSHFNTTLQTSPFQALTGRSISLPISLATQQPVDTKIFPLQKIFQRLLKEIFLAKNKSLKIRSRPYTNKKNDFKINDLIWLYIKPNKKN